VSGEWINSGEAGALALVDRRLGRTSSDGNGSRAKKKKEMKSVVEIRLPGATFDWEPKTPSSRVVSIL